MLKLFFAKKKLCNLFFATCTPILLLAQPSFPFAEIKQDLFTDSTLMKKHNITHVTASYIMLKKADEAKAYYSLKDIKEGHVLNSSTVESTKLKNKDNAGGQLYFGLDKKGRLIYERNSYSDISSNEWRNNQTPQVGKYYDYDKDGRLIAHRIYIRQKTDSTKRISCYAHFKYNYDKAGNIISKISVDEGHAKVYLTYDAKNRLITESVHNESIGLHSKKEYNYNAKKNSISTGLLTYFYNKQGQLVKTILKVKYAKNIETRKYNRANKIVKIKNIGIHKDQKEIEQTTYIYNSLGLLCREIKTSTQPRSSNQYVKTYRYYTTK